MEVQLEFSFESSTLQRSQVRRILPSLYKLTNSDEEVYNTDDQRSVLQPYNIQDPVFFYVAHSNFMKFCYLK